MRGVIKILSSIFLIFSKEKLIKKYEQAIKLLKDELMKYNESSSTIITNEIDYARCRLAITIFKNILLFLKGNDCLENIQTDFSEYSSAPSYLLLKDHAQHIKKIFDIFKSDKCKKLSELDLSKFKDITLTYTKSILIPLKISRILEDFLAYLLKKKALQENLYLIQVPLSLVLFIAPLFILINNLAIVPLSYFELAIEVSAILLGFLIFLISIKISLSIKRSQSLRQSSLYGINFMLDLLLFTYFFIYLYLAIMPYMHVLVIQLSSFVCILLMIVSVLIYFFNSLTVENSQPSLLIEFFSAFWLFSLLIFIVSLVFSVNLLLIYAGAITALVTPIILYFIVSYLGSTIENKETIFAKKPLYAILLNIFVVVIGIISLMFSLMALSHISTFIVVYQYSGPLLGIYIMNLVTLMISPVIKFIRFPRENIKTNTWESIYKQDFIFGNILKLVNAIYSSTLIVLGFISSSDLSVNTILTNFLSLPLMLGMVFLLLLLSAIVAIAFVMFKPLTKSIELVSYILTFSYVVFSIVIFLIFNVYLLQILSGFVYLILLILISSKKMLKTK